MARCRSAFVAASSVESYRAFWWFFPDDAVRLFNRICRVEMKNLRTAGGKGEERDDFLHARRQLGAIDGLLFGPIRPQNPAKGLSPPRCHPWLDKSA